MAYRNFLQLTAQVDRDINQASQVASAFEIQQAINDALNEITHYANWNFLLDRYDVPLVQSYATGTITATNGSTSITGSGTSWSTSWYNRKISIAGDPEEKEVLSFGSGTTLTLRYPLNSSASNLTGVTYTIFQDEFPIPLPFQYGRDLLCIDPVYRRRLKKLDRYSHEDRTVFQRYLTGTRPTHYTDAGTDTLSTSPTYGRPKMKFWPTPTTAQDLILIYYRAFTPLLLDTDLPILPNEFEEVLVRLAKYRVRKNNGINGWMEDFQYANRLLLQFREQAAEQTAYDYLIRYQMYPADPWAQDQVLGVWPGTVPNSL